MTSGVFAKDYADQYDLLYGDKDYEAECDILDQVFREHGDGRVRSVLDLGCGTGNHAFPLARRGYQVVGVDRSPGMLAQAGEKVASASGSNGVAPEFYLGDARSVDLGQTFDAVLMMFAVLGYQLTNDDVTAALATVRRHLRPGGLFVFDVWYGPAVLTVRPSDRVKVVPVPGGRLIRAASSRLDVRRHLCEVSYQLWRLEGDRLVGESSESHPMRYFFPLELEHRLSQFDITLESLCAFPEIEAEADESTWNVLGIGRQSGI